MFRSRPARLAGAALCVAAPTIFLASLFPASLMLLDTTTAGGDMGSHNYAAAFLRSLLLDRYRITGWVPGNYAGFPLFQMYFPLPFVAMVLASTVVSLNVAFKLTTVAGILALPLGSFLLLGRLRVPSPGPAIGASVMLLFLLQDGNTMWGGNVASTLAGEFTYSISLLFALMWFAVHDRALSDTRGMVAGAVVVAALSLTHAYTVLWVAGAAGIAAVVRRPTMESVSRYVAVFVWGGALCAFWLLPLVGYAPWTTAFRHLWVMTSVTEVLPRALWPVFAVVILAPLVIGSRGRDAWRTYMRSAGLLYAGAAAGAVGYAAAPNFGIVDVRFLPFLYLSLCLVAAAGAGHVLARWPAPLLSIPVVFLGAVILVNAEAARMGGWARWNYEGFEQKTLWPVHRSIIEHLRGGPSDPRVVFEHSPDHEALGTSRAFENLPLFSGRSTLEGVNMQASVTSPFVFYIQSEISEVMSCPFSEWGCSRPDLKAGVDHLRMFNVSDVILRSDTMKAAARNEPSLSHQATFGAYEIYAITGPVGGYVEALAASPFAVVSGAWKADAYQWFKRARPGDPMPVFVRDAADAAGAPVAAVVTDVSAPVARVAVPPGAALVEHLEPERIVVTGAQPGAPLLIKVSYHPRWRSASGEPVWLAGPGLMLVFPSTDRLELVYGPTALTSSGVVVSSAALALLIVVAIRTRRRAGSGPVAAVAPAASRVLSVSVAVGLMGLTAGLAIAGVRARQLDPDAIYREGQRLMDAGEPEAAVRAFQRARRLAPLSNTAIHATYFEAIALYRQERWGEAREVFRRLADEFPEAQAAAEATYHVGLCATRLGEIEAARHAFDETLRQFPSTYWAGVARERLDELAGNR